MDEFRLIQEYFERDSLGSNDVSVGIGDDGAVMRPSPGHELVQVVDTLVAGVHFPDNISPADIGFRSVAVNLSDIAAMGAVPRWMTLALTLPAANVDWLSSFAEGLFAAADAHGVTLVGGDTTSGPASIVTISISGEVESGQAILRSGASVGDGIFVSGTPGDAAAGLKALQQDETAPQLINRFLRPTPRIALGQALVNNASAAIDVSDGLAADLSKLLQASGVAGELDVDSLPVSTELRAFANAEEQWRFALGGGDDYELCVTGLSDALGKISGLTEIGRVIPGQGLTCIRDGKIVDMPDSGYRHFT